MQNGSLRQARYPSYGDDLNHLINTREHTIDSFYAVLEREELRLRNHVVEPSDATLVDLQQIVNLVAPELLLSEAINGN